MRPPRGSLEALKVVLVLTLHPVDKEELIFDVVNKSYDKNSYRNEKVGELLGRETSLLN